MKKILTLFCACLFALNLSAGPQAIIVGHANKSINIIDLQTKETVWQYVIPDKVDVACNSVVVLKDGKHIAVATEASAKVISLATKEVVWDYKAKENKKISQIHSVVALKDGGFSVFIAKTTGVEVLEVSSKFEIRETYLFDELKGGTNAHTMFRSITLAKDGTYLVPWWPEQAVYKMTRTGEILDKYVIGTSAFAASECGKGLIIYGSGDASTVDIFDTKQKKIVNKIDSFSFGDKKAWPQFLAHTQILGKDKYLVSNWTGHSKRHMDTKTDYLPVLFIMNSKGEIEWSYDDDQAKPEGVSLGISGVYYSPKALVK